MGIVHIVAFILLIVGGLNWGLFALTGKDIGSYLGGMDGTVAMIIYLLVAVAALVEIATHKSNCSTCQKMTGMGGMGGASPSA